jgi:hypothetical protein
MQFRKKPKAENLTGAAKIGAYVRHAAQEPKVLDRGRVAIDSTRSAYKRRIRKQNASPPAQLNDQKLWRDLQRVVEALRDASAALTETSTERSRGRVAFAGVALGVLAVGAVALIWKDKLRSLFSSETTGTEDEVGSPGAVETTQGSVETTVPAPPQVPSSDAPTVQAPLSPTDDAGD